MVNGCLSRLKNCETQQKRGDRNLNLLSKMESTTSRMALDNAEQLAAAIKSPRKSSISPKKKRQQRNGVNSDQENSITLSNSLSTANHLDPTPLSSSGPSLSEIAVMDVDHPTSGDTTASVKPKIQPNPAVCVLKTKVPALPSNPQIQGYYRRIRSTENAMWWSTQSQKRRAAYGVGLAGDSDSDNGMATNASQPLPTSQAPARMARPTNHFFP